MGFWRSRGYRWAWMVFEWRRTSRRLALASRRSPYARFSLPWRSSLSITETKVAVASGGYVGQQSPNNDPAHASQIASEIADQKAALDARDPVRPYHADARRE